MPPSLPEPDSSPPTSIEVAARRRRGEGADYDFEPVIGMLSMAIFGTALAGAAFPLVLGLCELAFGFGGPLRIADGGFLFAFALLGGMVGGVLALFLSVPVALFAGVVAWLSRITERDVWFASLVGGWTGYFATHVVLESLPMDFSHWVVIGLAVTIGQIGAGGIILWARRTLELNPASSQGESEVRFGLRQLFGITTSIALLAAFSEALKINQWAHAPTTFAATIQAAVIAITVAALRSRRPQPTTAQGVSREAPTPPA
jgi:hypothetical protein